MSATDFNSSFLVSPPRIRQTASHGGVGFFCCRSIRPGIAIIKTMEHEVELVAGAESNLTMLHS